MTVAVYATQSPLSSGSTGTVSIAAAIVLTTVAATAALALGHDRIALGLGALFVPAGVIGFALGPQLWLVRALLVLASTVEETALAAVLLVVVAALFVLTVATLSRYRTVGAVLASSSSSSRLAHRARSFAVRSGPM